MTNRIKLVATLLLLFVLTRSQVVLGQTKLNDLIGYALEHSHDIKKANSQVEEAAYLRKEARGQGLPQMEGSINYSRMSIPDINLPQALISAIPEQYAPMLAQLSDINALYTASAGIQLTQLIYSQSYLEGLTTTKKTQELYQLLKSKTEEEIIEEVANSYYQTRSLMLQLNTVDKSLLNLKELYRIVELNYQNDFVKESQLNRLKVTITNQEVSQQTIKNMIDVQLNYIKALAGMPADTAMVLDSTSLNTNIKDMVLNTSFSVDNVSSYHVLQKQNELNDQQIRLLKAKYLPTFAAYGQFNFSSYNTKAEIKKLNNMNTIGLKLTIPIFTSGVNYAKTKQAILKKEQTNETILKTKDLLTISYNNAFSEYQTALQLLDVQKENRDLAMKVFNQTSSQYKEGMASMADVLNVNSDFLQAENSYNQQILKCKLSEIKMMKSSGNLKDLIKNK
jgi:outer membrane protein